MEIDLTAILVAILPVVVTILLGIVVEAVRAFLKSRLNVNQIQFLDEIAVIGVRAAEQLYAKSDGNGKLSYATDLVQLALDRRGIKVDARVVRAAIESALVKEFNYGKLVDPAPTATTVKMEPSN